MNFWRDTCQCIEFVYHWSSFTWRSWCSVCLCRQVTAGVPLFTMGQCHRYVVWKHQLSMHDIILFQLLVVESRCYCWTLCTEFSNNIGRTSRHLYVKHSLLKSANITSYTPLLFPRFRPHVCGNGWRVFVHPPQTVHARRLRSFLEQQMVDTITICMN